MSLSLSLVDTLKLGVTRAPKPKGKKRSKAKKPAEKVVEEPKKGDKTWENEDE